MTALDHLDLQTALAAVSYFRRAHQLSKVEVPPAAERLAANLKALMAVNGQECVAPQPQWLTTQQVADRMQCSERTARRIATQFGSKIGRIWLTPETALPTED